MPVVKIPIQHRFGVISHSQKVKLQENILQELTTQEAQKQNERFNDPVEKCETLVQGRHSCVKSNKRHEIHETNLHDTKRLFFSCKNRIFFGSKFGLKINSSSHLSLLGHKYDCMNYG